MHLMYANYQAVLEVFGENSTTCKMIKQEKFQFSVLLVILITGQTGWLVQQRKMPIPEMQNHCLGAWKIYHTKFSQIQGDLTYDIANSISKWSTNNWEMEIHNANA